jgi:hypothetical protein
MSSGSRSDGINSFSWFHPALPKIQEAPDSGFEGRKTGHFRNQDQPFERIYQRGHSRKLPPLFRRLSPLDSLEQKRNSVRLMFQERGGHYAEDIRGRGCGADIDRAFCRDDRDLGAVDSPALRPRPALGPGWGRPVPHPLGEKRDGDPESRVPRGHFRPEASPLRRESAFEAARAPSSSSDRSRP